ncbi:MAG: DNA alkylation repair protein [Nitrospira sp.]|nr:DNA alkylation repair protein [Nitrospira sp.]
MAEPLKNHFGPTIPRTIAEMIVAVYPAFPKAQFLRTSLKNYEPLELMPRGRHIARALRQHLPDDYEEAIEILLASLGPDVPKQASDGGMAPFLYMPHTMFVQDYGLDHFEPSMRAQYELTQRFTAEFSIRPFLERHREATLARLTQWATDPSPDVRRLVSEGTRPRLPWAPRLRDFQADPQPVLALLDLLKDDPDLYVRRSVANNLNDIGKDHPALLAETAKKWMKNATEERRWLIRHALRSAVKRGEPGALHVLGAGHEANVVVRQRSITPSKVRLGQSVTVAFELKNAQSKPQRVMVDFQIHFVKANGSTSPKVFKLKMIELAPRASVSLKKTVSLKPMTTRRHYPGPHRVDILLNGRAKPLGRFELLAR